MADLQEGVIKYDSSDFQLTEDLLPEEYIDLEKSRIELWEKKLVGVYEQLGLGFGNISKRFNCQKFKLTNVPQFIITGTQTGHLSHLTGAQYTRVIDFDISKNKVSTAGPIQASSEALTHGLIYQSNSTINAIFHLHHPLIWRKMIDANYPATDESIQFGTKELALAAAEFAKQSAEGYFAIKGHEDGIIVYASSIEMAHQLSLKLVSAFS